LGPLFLRFQLKLNAFLEEAMLLSVFFVTISLKEWITSVGMCHPTSKTLAELVLILDRWSIFSCSLLLFWFVRFLPILSMPSEFTEPFL